MCAYFGAFATAFSYNAVVSVCVFFEKMLVFGVGAMEDAIRQRRYANANVIPPERPQTTTS
jgi:hypothetical protein